MRLAQAAPSARFRHVVRGGIDYYLFFNEGESAVAVGLEVATPGKKLWLDPWGGTVLPDADTRRLELAPHGTRVLRVELIDPSAFLL